MFHKTRSWESDSEAPQTPQSPQERCRKPLARLPPLIQWALASQMTQQMFTFVVIAFETGFREINHRLKYFKEYHISLLFLHFYITILLSFLCVFFFFCLYCKAQSLICVCSKEPWFTHMCSIRKKAFVSRGKDSLIVQRGCSHPWQLVHLEVHYG